MAGEGASGGGDRCLRKTRRRNTKKQCELCGGGFHESAFEAIDEETPNRLGPHRLQTTCLWWKMATLAPNQSSSQTAADASEKSPGYPRPVFW